MRALGIIAVVALVGVLAWMFLGGQDDQTPEPAAQVETPAPEAEPEAEAPAAAEAVDEAVDQATDDAANAVEELNEEAADAVETVEEQVNETVEAAEEMATDAVESAQETVNEAVEGAVESVSGALGGASDAVESATDDAAPEVSTENEMQTETTTELSDALTVEGFDAARLIEAVENSNLGFAESNVAKSLIAQAKDNPEMIQSVIGQLKDMLGPQ